MAYNLQLSNSNPLTVLTDGLADTTSTSLTLIGKNYPSYGLFLNENLVYLLENFAKSTAPLHPLPGQLWWDSSTGLLKVYSAATKDVTYDVKYWKVVSASTASSTKPATNPVAGDLWWDTINSQLNVYSGNAWILIGPSYTQQAGQTTAQGATVLDSGGQSHVILKFIVGNQLIGIFSKDATFTPNPAIANFDTIKPGFNLSSQTGPTLSYWGIANSAINLNIGGTDVPSSRFIRSDVSVALTQKLPVQSNDGIEIGTTAQGKLKIAGTEFQVISDLGSQDLVFYTRTSGVQTRVLTLNGTYGNVILTKDPKDPLGAATKQYVDGVLSGLTSANASVASFQTYANTKIGTNTNSNLVVMSATPSTSTTTGAIVVNGGGGIGGNLIVGGITSVYGNIGTLATTTSTSTTTGALVVAGGAGIAGNTYIAGNVILSSATSSNVVVASTTDSSSATTGALVVSGGLAVGATLYAGSNAVISGKTTHSGNVALAAGSTTQIPLLFSTSSSANTTVPVQGAVEYNSTANVFYATPTNATSSGRAIIPTTHYFVLGSNVAINNGTAPTAGATYSVFGGPVGSGTWVGNVTLAAGTTYEFEVKAMVAYASAPTTGALSFGFAGSATVTYSSYETTYYPLAKTVQNAGTVVGAANVSNYYGTDTSLSTVSSTTGTWTNIAVKAKGLIRINAQGTLSPVLSWGTAPGQVATAVQGSYAKFTPLGTTANIAVGTSNGFA